jgi:hypothetical protein
MKNDVAAYGVAIYAKVESLHSELSQDPYFWSDKIVISLDFKSANMWYD